MLGLQSVTFRLSVSQTNIFKNILRYRSGGSQSGHVLRSETGERLFRLLILLIVGFVVVIGSTDRASARYAAIVVEAKTGRILHSTNAETKNYPDLSESNSRFKR